MVDLAGNPGRVSLNETCTSRWSSAWTGWSPDRMQDARWLNLGSVAASPGAVALVAALSATVAASETRGNRRGATGMASLRRAVGGIVGGLLGHWEGSEPHASFRPMEPASFTGALVGHRQFVPAMEGLLAARMVEKARGIRFVADSWGDSVSFSGLASRYRPTTHLLDLATVQGVVPATLSDDFRQEYSRVAPTVRRLVELRALKPQARGTRQRRPTVYQDVPPHLATAHAAIEADVRAANKFAAGFTIEGCLPPRWQRVFTETFGLHGRWYAVGSDGVYQRMSEAERLDITINGEPVSEIDVTASHLAILLAMFGQPMPNGDPYEAEGFDRATVKAWITATLGKGSPVKRWAASVKATIRTQDARKVGAAVLSRYAFLEKPWSHLPPLSGLGPRHRLLTYCLMGLEASALSAAMASLRGQGVLALPMHDGLIVPHSAEAAAMEAMRLAFREITGASVRLTVDRPEAGAG